MLSILLHGCHPRASDEHRVSEFIEDTEDMEQVLRLDAVARPPRHHGAIHDCGVSIDAGEATQHGCDVGRALDRCSGVDLDGDGLDELYLAADSVCRDAGDAIESGAVPLMTPGWWTPRAGGVLP